jgi:hypothetical protein
LHYSPGPTLQPSFASSTQSIDRFDFLKLYSIVRFRLSTGAALLSTPEPYLPSFYSNTWYSCRPEIHSFDLHLYGCSLRLIASLLADWDTWSISDTSLQSYTANCDCLVQISGHSKPGSRQNTPSGQVLSVGARTPWRKPRGILESQPYADLRYNCALFVQRRGAVGVSDEH